MKCLTPEVAREIADLRADPELQARLDELAAKANEGALTEQERADYRAYIDAIDLISVLQSKARSVVKASERS